jgi:hypothetical protein
MTRLPALAGAVAAALIVWLGIPRAADDPTLRSKGSGALVELFTLNGDEKTPVTGAIPALSNLAARVAPRALSHVRILWSSTPDRWDALYPDEGEDAWTIAGPSWLDRSIVLDGALQPETLGVVSCAAPVDHAGATALLRGAAREGCRVERMRIDKR